MTYIELISESVILDPFKSIIILLTVFIFLVIVIGAALIYWSMKKNYMPIYRMQKRIETYIGKTNHNSSFEIIEDGISSLESEVSHLSEELIHRRKTLINIMLC